jgi:hypothetical protein
MLPSLPTTSTKEGQMPKQDNKLSTKQAIEKVLTGRRKRPATAACSS